MKYSFYLTALLSILFAPAISYSEDRFEACEVTKEAALTSLIKRISVKVEASNEQKISVSGGITGEKVEKEANTFSKQSSSLDLADVNYRKQNGESCAYVTYASFIKFTVSLINDLKKLKTMPLPKRQDDRVKKYDEMVSLVAKAKERARVVDVIAPASLSAYTPDLVSAESDLTKLKDQLQAVHFDLEGGNNISIRIDDALFSKESQEKYASGKDIFMVAGSHSFTISGPEICNYSGSFQLNKGDLSIIKADLGKYKLPALTVTSNQPDGTLKLLINGRNEVVGKIVTLPQCSGNIEVKLQFSGDDEPQIENVELAPGLNKSLSMNFVSVNKINQAKEIAKTFREDDRLEVLYSFSVPTMDTQGAQIDNFTGLSNLAMNYTQRAPKMGWLRYGWGGLLGKSGDNSAGELYYNLMVQGVNFGSKERPLMLGTLIFIPFAGIQAGAGYHEYLMTDKSKLTSTNNRSMGFGVLKYVIGMDIPVSKDFAIQISGGYNQFLDKSVFFNAGVSFDIGR